MKIVYANLRIDRSLVSDCIQPGEGCGSGEISIFPRISHEGTAGHKATETFACASSSGMRRRLMLKLIEILVIFEHILIK